MKRFAGNILVFSLLMIVFYIAFYWFYLYFTLPRHKNAVYLWGDSQMYQDLDLDYMNKNTNYHFYSSALHGAGIYDFLVFTQLTPENSNVIIQISNTVLLRRKSVDRNYSALNWKALCELKKDNYNISELESIVKNNIVPHKIFDDKNILFPSGDTIKMTEPMSLFTTVYSQKPVYFYDKANLYFYGIKTLLNKKCRIIALILPDNPELDKIEQASPYVRDLELFNKQIGNFFVKKDTIAIPIKENIFYDLTHLNSRGAGYLSQQLATRVDFENAPSIICIKPAAFGNP